VVAEALARRVAWLEAAFEIIRHDDGSEDGAWLSSTVRGHEVIYVRDHLGGAA
jgi:hypothetical protein